ncbi:MAG: ABC transporter permease, partial [Planctomycetota bacterium]|nr:ABC transporter permease [Planctomycetota bacterium]
MKNLEYYKDLVLVLTRKEIKVRYASSILGYLWSVANPLAISFVFYIAFKIVMRIQIEAYSLFLITGLFPWQWLSNSISVSPMIFLGNASIIKKVNFPRNVLPLVTVLQDMVHFILAIPVIIIFMFIYHKTPSWSWLYGIPI